MGCSASCTPAIPLQSPYEVPDVCRQNKMPEAIENIMGQEVDRSHPMYLYAIFGLTRLLEEYRKLMFPDLTSDLITFCDDESNYVTVVNEVYETLNYNEIQTNTSSRLGSDHEQRAKDAVQELAYLYFLCSTSSIELAIVKTMVFKVDEEYLANKKMSGEDDTLRVIYEDTLKMLITDLERKDIYTPSVFENNRRFQEWLKYKEHTTWKELKQKSVTFLITPDSGESLPRTTQHYKSNRLAKKSKEKPYCRMLSRQSSDSIGFYYSDWSQTDINDETPGETPGTTHNLEQNIPCIEINGQLNCAS